VGKNTKPLCVRVGLCLFLPQIHLLVTLSLGIWFKLPLHTVCLFAMSTTSCNNDYQVCKIFLEGCLEFSHYPGTKCFCMQQLSNKQQQWSHRASMGFKTLIDLIFSVIGGIKCQYWRPSNSSSHGKCKTVAWNGTVFYHSLATYTNANSVLSHLAMVICTKECITRAYILSQVCP
jgi:hypothetical protein